MIDVGVVGVPDAVLGERVGAVVVADGDLRPEEVVAHCAGRLSGYKTPELVTFADELPETVLGKPDRAALRVLLAGVGPVTRPPA